MGKTPAKKGPVSRVPASVKKAQATEKKILSGCEAIRTVWIALAGQFYDFFEGKMWTDLGCETFNEWLGQPQIELGRTQVYGLIEAYREFVIERDVDPAELGGFDHSKLTVVLPAVRSGEVTLEEALSDCESLSRSDLRAKYQGELPEKTGEGAGAGGKQELVQCVDCGKMREADATECPPEVDPNQMEID